MYTNDGSDDSRKLKADFFSSVFTGTTRQMVEREKWLCIRFSGTYPETQYDKQETLIIVVTKSAMHFKYTCHVTCLTIPFFFSSPKVDSFRRKAHISAYIICQFFVLLSEALTKKVHCESYGTSAFLARETNSWEWSGRV